jgi:hypothetical protein
MFSLSTGYYVSPPIDQHLKFKNRCSLLAIPSFLSFSCMITSAFTVYFCQSLFSHYFPINLLNAHTPPISRLIPAFHQPAHTILQPACSYHPSICLLIPSLNLPAHTILQSACSYHPLICLLIQSSNLPAHTIL